MKDAPIKDLFPLSWEGATTYEPSDDRMANALALADKCWNKAYASHPEFVEAYLKSAHKLLCMKQYVLGDEFRDAAKNDGLFLPKDLHHNTWVSGVRALSQIGWVTSIKKVEPTKNHNHMPVVTMWRSELFGEQL